MDIIMSKIVFLLSLTLSYGVSGFTGRGLVYPGRIDLFELSILHINDFHARFEEIGPTAGACHRKNGEICIGGIARLFTAVQQMIDERPNSIFLNAGDHYQGTLWYNVHRWNVTAIFMNMLPHDAMTIGNHEFDDKIRGLVPFLENVKAPVVVSNIDTTYEPSMKNLMKNSTIIYRDGKKIGIIGVILQSTPEIASTEKLIFLDEVTSVNLEASKLKERENVDIIIVLSHCGLEIDRIMAANCPLIDIIVGGHSHTFLYTGAPPFVDRPEDEYPVVVTQEQSNRTVLIVQAAAFTKYLGNLTVWFDEQGEIVDWDGNPILLDDSIAEDTEILAALEPWKAALDEMSNKVIGQTNVKLEKNCRQGECNLGNMITDAMIETWIDRAENESYWTYAAAAFMNGGGIRAPIDSATGDITYGDIVMSQPFENTWDVVEMLGQDIRETLEVCVSMAGSTQKWYGYRFLVWSGIKTTYDMSKEPYNRVVEAKIRCRKCLIPIYENIIDNEWYKIVVPSFLVGGGDGHSIIATRHRNHEIGPMDIDKLTEFIERMSPIIHGKEGRVVI